MNMSVLVLRAVLVLLCAGPVSVGLALAHSFDAGDLKINHPYASPTPGDIRNGAVYFLGITNLGKTPDRLLSARANVSERVELHRMVIDGGVMRMREIEAIALPPGEGPSFSHGKSDAYHLMLINLKAPLKEGDHFPVWLKFEKAGEKEVMVWVLKPKGGSAEPQHHKH